MSRPTMTPSTVTAAAGVASAVGSELTAIGASVSGFPIPEGVEGDIAGRLAAAGASLTRAGSAVGSQSAWLRYRAALFLAADAPGGGLLRAGLSAGPSLLSPFAVPPKGKGFWRGLRDGALDTGEGFLRTVSVANQNSVGRVWPKELMPFGKTQRRWNKEFEDGVKWANAHPAEFAAAVGRDMVAYDDHADGETGYALGKNVVAVLGFFVPISKISKLGVAARGVKRAAGDVRVAERARDAAAARRDTAHQNRQYYQRDAVQGQHESDADFRVRQAARPQLRAASDAAWERATDRANEAREAAVRARDAAKAADDRMADAKSKLREQMTSGTEWAKRGGGVVTDPVDPRAGASSIHQAFESHRDDQAKERKVDARNNR